MTKNNTKWDMRWLEMALLISTWSKDTSRRVGCVIVDDRKVVLSVGYNGFPRGVDDSVSERYDRPIKYKFTSHAEANAIANAAANGTKLLGSTLYCTLRPCADCARLIIQAGIRTVVTISPVISGVSKQYVEDVDCVDNMFKEAGIRMTLLQP